MNWMIVVLEFALPEFAFVFMNRGTKTLLKRPNGFIPSDCLHSNILSDAELLCLMKQPKKSENKQSYTTLRSVFTHLIISILPILPKI